MRSRIKSYVVITEPISTTNITGFFINVRGFSLMNESRSAPLIIPPVQSDFFLRSRETTLWLGSGMFAGDDAFCSSVICVVMVASENLSGVHQHLLENRTQAQGREKCKCADNQNHGHQQHGEKRSRNRKGACRFRHELLARQVAGDGHDRYHFDE